MRAGISYPHIFGLHHGKPRVSAVCHQVHKIRHTPVHTRHTAFPQPPARHSVHTPPLRHTHTHTRTHTHTHAHTHTHTHAGHMLRPTKPRGGRYLIFCGVGIGCRRRICPAQVVCVCEREREEVCVPVCICACLCVYGCEWV